MRNRYRYVVVANTEDGRVFCDARETESGMIVSWHGGFTPPKRYTYNGALLVAAYAERTQDEVESDWLYSIRVIECKRVSRHARMRMQAETIAVRELIRIEDMQQLDAAYDCRV